MWRVVSVSEQLRPFPCPSLDRRMLWGHRLLSLVWLWRAPPSPLLATPSRISPHQRPPPNHHDTMAIAPITGKLRKRFWLDLTTALGLGVSAGYAFW